MWNRSSCFLVLLVAATALIFPPPRVERFSPGHLLLPNPCSLFHFHSEHPLIQGGYYFNKIVHRLNRQVPCPRHLVFNKEQHIKLEATEVRTLEAEAYQIFINEEGVTINYGDYSGYVYALESLSQLAADGKLPFVYVQDQPVLSYRGIMIDSARHYLGVAAIKRLIQSMPLSKLNILHWHLEDDESFPIVLDSHPELAQGARYSSSEIYTKQDVLDIIAVAKQNAVQIVPEIDTPAHTRSWGQSAQWAAKNISIECAGGTGYNGQLDLSIPEVFTLVKEVVQQIDVLFKDSPYLHLGGDEVSSRCWDLRPQIQTFMQNNSISNYGQLQMYWRQQIKSVLQPNRRVMFWRNDAQDVTTTGNDILHFWGSQPDVATITANTTSDIILSPSDMLYLNKGQGNLWLNGTQGTYSVWRDIYENFTVFPPGVNTSRILGAEVCLWGEVSNEDTLENNLWMRASAFAARVWSEQILQTYEIVTNLVALQYTLYGMNVDASPVTSEFCEKKPAVCFPPAGEPAEVEYSVVEM